MKKLCSVISLILVGMMLVGTLTSCSTLEKNDRGAIITAYLTDEIYDFDPLLAYTDASAARILSLVYEGLTRLNEKGNWEKAMMSGYKEIPPVEEDDGYKIRVELRANKWSDGRPVQAGDFVTAWERILEPTTACEAAALLFDVKNAKEIKMGDVSVDDLGVRAVEPYVLEIEFAEKEVDLDAFFRACASIALVPLRSDKVGASDKWAKRSSSMVFNGPFAIRGLTIGQELRLERSAYYYRDTDSNQALDKYVIPYRIVIKYGYGNTEKQLERFENGDIFYLGELPLSSREQYANEANVSDGTVTYTYVFNTNHPLLAKAEVRRALSMVIDRDELAKTIVFADPATGLIPPKVFDANGKGSFRTTGDSDGALIAASADVAAAKALMQSAGVSSGTLNLTIRPNEVDQAVAAYVASAWEQLGIRVNITPVAAELEISTEQNQSNTYKDVFHELYESGDFDVIAIDHQMLSSDAFSALAKYAAVYSGNGVDMESPDYDVIPSITGYNSEAYNTLISEAYAAGADSAARTEKLHEAEQLLCEDMPVMPLLFLQDAYIYKDKVLSGIKETFWGRDLRRVRMRDYMDYKESLEAAETDNQ